MFLVNVPFGGLSYWVFLREDPRPGCRPFGVVEGVDFDRRPVELRWWWSGAPSAIAFGRSRSEPRRYRLFEDPKELDRAGFEPVDGLPWIHRNWQEFLRSPQGRYVVQ